MFYIQGLGILPLAFLPPCLSPEFDRWEAEMQYSMMQLTITEGIQCKLIGTLTRQILSSIISYTKKLISNATK